MTNPRPPLQIDDLFNLVTLGDPQITPDGRLVAYTASTLRPDDDGSRTNIWLVSTAGGPPRRLTNGPRSDHSPRWSPDGRRIAFVSNRLEGKPPQIWTIPADGGEASQLTNLPSGVSGPPVWSPDGTRIAFVSRVGPLDDAGRNRRPRVVRRLRFQLNGAGYIGDSFWQVFVVPVAEDRRPAAARLVTSGEWHHFHPAWSPDGRQLALVTTRRPDWDLEWIWDIHLLALDHDGGPAGEPRRLTASTGVALGPAWSPDGREIAYYDNQNPFTGSTADYHLWVIPAAGGPARNLSAALDRTAIVFEPPANLTPPTWLGDGASLAWTVFDAGHPRIAVADRDGAQPTRIVEWPGAPPIALAWSVASDGQTVAILGGSPVAPGEVFAGALRGTLQQLTDVNADFLATRSVRGPETFTHPAPDGTTIESRLWLPPDVAPGAGSLPTALHFHGGPHGATGTHFSFIPLLLAGQGYAVVSVNFRGSAGYGADFAARIRQNWGPLELEDGLAALDALVQQGIADPTRLGVYGSSYGGFMTNYAIAHSDRFAAAVTLATIASLETLSSLTDQWESIDWDQGGPPWERAAYYRDHSPLTRVARITTPVLILHGEADHTCTIAEAEQLFVALRKLRRTVEFVRYPGESHGFVGGGRPSTRVDAYQRLLDWFNRYMRGATTGEQR